MPSASTLLSPIPLAFATAILFGLAMIVAQRGVRAVPTLPGAAAANVSAALLAWLAAPVLLETADASVWPLTVFVLVGLFFPASVTVLMLEGNRRLGPSVTATISGTTPLFAYLGAVALLGEVLRAQGLIGTATIVIGIAILAWRRSGLRAGIAPWIVALPLGAALIRAIAQILIKYGLVLWPNPFAAILIAYTASATMVCALLGLRGERIPRVRAVGWFVASGLMNGLGTLAMYAAFRAGDVTVVAPIVATAPLVTLVVGSFVLREEPVTPRLVLGVVVTLVGVALILLR